MMKYFKLLFLPFVLLILQGCQTQSPLDFASKDSKVTVEKLPTLPVQEDIKPKQGAYKIGLMIPLSGDFKDLGTDILLAAQMALADSQRKDLELKIYDTQGKKGGAVQAMQNALQDKVHVVIGPLFSTEVTAIHSLAKNAGIPVISFSNQKAVQAPGIFAFGYRLENQIANVWSYAAQNNIQSIAALLPESKLGHYSQGIIKDLPSNITVQFYSYAGGARDFTAIVEKLKAQPVQAIFSPETTHNLSLLLGGLAYQDLDLTQMKVLGTGQLDDPTIPFDLTLVGTWLASSPPEMYKEFLANFKMKFHHTPRRLSFLGYDAMTLVTHLIEQYPQSPFELSHITQEQGFKGINGTFRLLPDGGVERLLAILEVQALGFNTLRAAEKHF